MYCQILFFKLENNSVLRTFCKQGHKPVLGNTGLSTVGSLARQAAGGPGAGHAAEVWSVRVGWSALRPLSPMWPTPCSQGKVENVHECPRQSLDRRHDEDEPGTAEGLGQALGTLPSGHTLAHTPAAWLGCPSRLTQSYHAGITFLLPPSETLPFFSVGSLIFCVSCFTVPWFSLSILMEYFLQ